MSRFLGIDLGRRRIGLALSDHSGVLATPWESLEAGPTIGESAERVGARIADCCSGEDGGLDAVVVGLPRRLNGEDNDETPRARAFAQALATRVSVPVHFQDERLTSREAESRLALREKSWRRRKARLDAAAAAVILQDFLDARPGVGGSGGKVERS
jgi:putative Holliday junction resolvase